MRSGYSGEINRDARLKNGLPHLRLLYAVALESAAFPINTDITSSLARVKGALPRKSGQAAVSHLTQKSQDTGGGYYWWN
jgi:hypothetical protein